MSDRDRDARGRPAYAGPRDRYGRPRPRGAPHLLQRPAPAPESVADAVAAARERFDRRAFFEAHELFEQVWKSSATPPEEAPFWKAVTQVSVGFCHLQRGNPAGARSVLARAAALLERDGRVLHEIDASRLAGLARRVLERVAGGASAEEIAFPALPRG